MTLTEGENTNGSWYCSTHQAEQDLKAWFDDVGEFIENYQSEFGEKPQWDAFTQAEQFHCLMMIMGVEQMLNSTATIQEYWNKKIRLTPKIIKQIISEL